MTVIDHRRRLGVSSSIKLPSINPSYPCKLKKLKLERLDDWLLLENQFISNQEAIKPDIISNIDEKDEEKDSGLTNIEQVNKLSGTPIIIGNLEEFIDDNHCIVSLRDSGSSYYVKILSFVDKKLLKLNSKVLLHAKMHHVVGSLPNNTNPIINAMKVEYAPDITYNDIGGLEEQINEIKECVELPLTNPELFEQIGIEPPCGAILYGPPGTGKSLLAKAVANKTNATFLRLSGSELISSYSGAGPKLVKELFDIAKQLQPTIIFIDEIDAVGTKRYNASSSGEREIQRTMIELLTQLNGFDKREEIKVIMATNCIQNLDPALIRNGRIDRKIQFPLPNLKTKLKIFKIHTKNMTLSDDVMNDFKIFINDNDDLSGADIKSICTEAGLFALREKRINVNIKDFRRAKEIVIYRKKSNVPDGMYL